MVTRLDNLARAAKQIQHTQTLTRKQKLAKGRVNYYYNLQIQTALESNAEVRHNYGTEAYITNSKTYSSKRSNWERLVSVLTYTVSLIFS